MNVNGIQNAFHEIQDFLHKHDIKVACFQETKLRPDSPPLQPFSDFATLRKDRNSGKGGGLIILIHHSLAYRELSLDSLFPNDPHLEHLAATITIDGAELRVVNIYILPTSSCSADYQPDLLTLFSSTNDTLIMGDFNAHDAAWFSSTSDSRAAARGARIIEDCFDGEMQLLNGDSPTRVPSCGPKTSPDLTFASAHLANGASWETMTTLCSDHLPIMVDLGGWFSSPSEPFGRRSYTNYRKADWGAFTREVEMKLSSLPPPLTCTYGQKTLREILCTVC